MVKLFIFSLFSLFLIVNTLRYHVKLDIGNDFKPVFGSLNIWIVQGKFNFTQHPLKTESSINPGKLYVLPVNIDIEINKITQVTFFWEAKYSKNSKIQLNQLYLIPTYIKDDIQRTRSKLRLCPKTQWCLSGVQIPLNYCNI